MRKRTVRSGLRLLSFSVTVLLLGILYAQSINTLLVASGDGAPGLVKLAFFWGAVLGTAAMLMIAFGLVQRSLSDDTIRLLPSLFFLLLLVSAFIALFYRTLSTPPHQPPLRPGETLLI